MKNSTPHFRTNRIFRFLLLVSFCLLLQPLAAQCPAGNVTFNSQQDVNDFASNYPTCTVINGNLSISFSDVTDLSPLSNITSIGGYLVITDNDLLTDLVGLSNLTSIGDFLSISSNDLLENIDAISQLTSIGGNILIQRNPQLTDLNGFSNLTTTDGITILFNPLISDLNAFSNISSLNDRLHISDNASLSNLDGLSNLTSVGGSLTISNCPLLPNLDALSNLTSVGGVEIGSCSMITNLDALSNITSLNSYLAIVNNAALTNIHGISNLTSVGENIFLRANPSITNLDALSNITVVGENVYIQDNPILSDMQGLCPLFEAGFSGSLIQSDNGTSFNPGSCGCPSENLILGSQKAINDFGTNYPNCTSITGIVSIYGSDITDLSPLANLTSVGGDLRINYISAGNIDGLENLNSVGGKIVINACYQLADINGLSGINSAGGIQITNTALLTSLNGLSGINSLSGDILLEQNIGLANIDGLSNITSIGGSLFMINNPVLPNLDALASLEFIGMTLQLGFNTSLENINGLSLVSNVKNIIIINNPIITNIDALSGLTSVELGITIVQNASLANLNGLSNITTAGNIRVTDNPMLVNMDGLCLLFLEGFSGQFTQSGNGTIFDPANCAIPCNILTVTVGDPYDCEPNSDTYKRDLIVDFEGTISQEDFMVKINGGSPIAYPIANPSPQVLTLHNLPSNGQWVDIEVYVSGEDNCSWSENNLFQNPQSCTGPGGDCDITHVSAGDQRCDGNTYEQDLIISYEHAPSTGTLLVKINNQNGWESFPISNSPQTLTLTHLTPDGNEVDIFVKFSDDNGCTFSANNLFTAPNSCQAPPPPPSGNGDVLFVVANASNLHSGDAAVKARLEGLGHSVQLISDENTQSSSANGKSLIVISNSVSSGQVGAKFTSSNVPLICYETYLYDDLGMTSSSGFGNDNGETRLDIQAAGHQMAAGFSGYVTVQNSSGQLAYGHPNSNAIVVASTDGSSSQATVFGYESGVSMVSGTAPSRRVGIFLKDSEVSKLNANGWSIFDAAVCWATNCVATRKGRIVQPTAQLKAYPNPFSHELNLEWQGPAQEVEVRLVNLIGQQLMRQQLTINGSHRLQIINLPKGMYILRVFGKDFKQEMKLLKR